MIFDVFRNLPSDAKPAPEITNASPSVNPQQYPNGDVKEPDDDIEQPDVYCSTWRGLA